MKKIVCLTAVFLLMVTFLAQAGEKKALIYLLDGCRGDAMSNLAIPSWIMLRDGKWAAGYHTAWTLAGATCPDMEPSSGQNHTTTVTGLNGARHGMTSGAIFENYEGPVLPTFLEQIGERNPDFTSASYYGWSYDWVLRPGCGRFQLITAGDEQNGKILAGMLAAESCPDAIFVQDNDIDLWGHTNGFYPYSPRYEQAVREAMQRFEKALEVIRKRPSFEREDWLIILCSDHGGWAKTHGKVGGHSSNIPLLVCGKHIPAGMMTGRYDLRDVAPWVVTHFGYAELLEGMDGKNEIKADNKELCPVEQGLVLSVPAAGAIGERNNSLVIPGLTDVAGLRAFTVAFALIPAVGTPSAPVTLLANGQEASGKPGFVFYMDEKGELRLRIGCLNAPKSFLVPEPDRMELGPLHLTPGKKNLVVFAITEDGVVTMAHRAENEHLYFFSCDTPGLMPLSGKAWSSGSGENSAAGRNIIWSDRKIWNRALTIPEIQAYAGAVR